MKIRRKRGSKEPSLNRFIKESDFLNDFNSYFIKIFYEALSWKLHASEDFASPNCFLQMVTLLSSSAIDDTGPNLKQCKEILQSR